MQIPLGLSAKKRRTTWNPIVRVVNLLGEQSEANRYDGVDHIQRPGEVLFATLGAGPIRGVFRQAGTFGGDFLVVSGTNLYRVTEAGVVTLVGAVTGTDRVIYAATANRCLIAANGVAYSTDGSTVTTVTMPDGRPVTSVAQLNGYFILVDGTTNSARIYYIEPGDTNPDGLDYFSTESVPGVNVRIIRVGDELWVLKEEGVEVHIPTGDADLPFQRVPGRNYAKGCRSRDSVARFDNSVVWVGSDDRVYRGDAAPVRISDHSLEEQLRKSNAADDSGWSFSIDGHDLYCLSLSNGTYALDGLTGQWPEFKTWNRTGWRCHVGDRGESFTVAGSDEDGRLFRLDPDVHNDAGLPLERIVTGGVPVVGPMQRCDSFQLYAYSGTESNPNASPVAWVRWSDDLETYSDPVKVPLGFTGQYGKPLRINRLGGMRYPGRLFEISVTDDVEVTIQAAAINEPSR